MTVMEVMKVTAVVKSPEAFVIALQLSDRHH